MSVQGGETLFSIVEISSLKKRNKKQTRALSKHHVHSNSDDITCTY
jgi:hypothetical protein